MSKIPRTINRKDLLAKLNEKGFDVTNEGSGHIRVRYYVDVSKLESQQPQRGKKESRKSGGKTMARTIVSRGTKRSGDIPPRILGQIARDLRITRPQLFQLVDCSLSQEDYEKHLLSLPPARYNPH